MQTEEMNAKKAEIMAQLAKLGVKTATVNYSGSDDEGYIRDIDCFDANNERVAIGDDLEREMSDLCCKYVERDCPGWEIGTGSNGDFQFNVDKGSIHWTHNDIVESYDTTETDL